MRHSRETARSRTRRKPVMRHVRDGQARSAGDREDAVETGGQPEPAYEETYEAREPPERGTVCSGPTEKL